MATLILCIDVSSSPVAAAQRGSELRRQASDLAYNLDYEDALRLLRQAIALDPSEPENHRALASTIWMSILFRRGAVTVDHYLGSFSRTTVDLKKPPPDLDEEFKKELARAIELSEQRVAAAPRDAQARYDLGTALGLRASYIASVEGRLAAGVSAARRSYDELEHVMALDPSRRDAGLIVGTYRYLVSTLSLPMRLMAYVAGFGGGRDRGLRLVEQTAASAAENRTDAMFALVLLYNRERRYGDALRVLGDLRQRFPRNRLIVLEAGATAARAGRPGEAEALLTAGLTALARETRPLIPGERGLWHYKRGAARVQLKRDDAAAADLRVAIEPESAGWVQGRAHLELATMARERGNADGARAEARLAMTACENDHDPACVDQAKRMLK